MQSDRDQLKDLAGAMQRQIELLTRAVDELKEVRQVVAGCLCVRWTGLFRSGF